MIRRVLFALTAFLAFAATSRLEAQSVIVGVGGELSAAVSSDIMAPVFADMRASGGRRLGSYTIRLSWDRTVLQYLGVEAGVFAQPQIQTDSVFSFGVLYAAAISVPGSDDVVDLLRLKFRVLAATSSTVSVLVKEMSAATTFTDLLSLVATINSTFCGAIGRWGDLDGDSLSNSRDALAILSSVVGLTVAPQFVLSRGDVNGDTKVNTVDALIILSYAVGLDIFGQRVLVPIPGACGSAPQTTLAVLPDTADVTVGQRVHLKVLAKTLSGVFVSLAVNWTVIDPGVAVVDQTGLLVGRGPGTTRAIAALGPGIRYSVPVVTRARRGTWIVNAPLAKRNPVQLGTLRWPFSTPQHAFPLAAEGDTIRVLPGTHDYENYSDEGFDALDFADEVKVGVVLIGDTLPNGTRPILRGPAALYSYGVDWTGGRQGEIRNLELRGFYYPVYLEGLANLRVQNVLVARGLVTYGYGIYAANRMDTLRILNSEFRADTLSYSYDAVYVSNGAYLVQVLNSQFARWGGAGVKGYEVDSLDAQGNVFIGNSQGIYIGANSTGALRARVSRNRFLDNASDALTLLSLRRGALDHNYIRSKGGDGIQASGTQFIGGAPAMTGLRRVQGAPAVAEYNGVLTSQADSVDFRTTSSRSWIDAEALDSILVDSAWVQAPADSAMYMYGYLYANYARVTRSKLLNLYYYGFQFRGRKLDVDNTTFAGCLVVPTCTWGNGYAIYATAYNDSGPAVTLTNSTFSVLAYALYAPSTADSAGPLVITGNTGDSLGTFVYAYADSVVASNNILTRINSYGFLLRPSYSNRPARTAAVLNNRVTCAGTSGTGIRVDDTPLRIDDNVVRNCYYGIYAYSPSSGSIMDLRMTRDSVAQPSVCCGYGIYMYGRWRPTVYGNRVVGGYYGMYFYGTDSGTVVIDSNAVSGTAYMGLGLEHSGTFPAAMTGRRNRIANNVTYGIYDGYHVAGTRSFTDGAIYGNGTSVYNYGPTTFTATDNWWGSAGGPPVSGPNSVAGAVTTTGFKTSDPPTTIVPPLTAPPVVSAATMAVGPSGPPADPPAPASMREPGTSAEEFAKAQRRAVRERARQVDDARAAQARAERRARFEARRAGN